MTPSASRLADNRRCAGFSLIEALVAVALMGIVLSAIATLTGQWLPKWDRGFARAQRAESIGVALERMVADLSAAQFIPPNRDVKPPLFEGTETAVTFVRTPIGPNIRPGLDVVRIAETADERGRVLVRRRAPFAPGATGRTDFSDPVALIRAPYRVFFSYGNAEGAFRDTWLNAETLPVAIRLIVRDETTGRVLAISTATLVHVQLPATAACAGACGAQAAGAPGQPNGATASPNSNAGQPPTLGTPR